MPQADVAAVPAMYLRTVRRVSMIFFPGKAVINRRGGRGQRRSATRVADAYHRKHSEAPMAHFPSHIMTKPIGPICNLDCKYCFYLEKEKLYPGTKSFKMPDDVLENYVKQYIQSQNAPTITFAWQGGEPTLMGLDFFTRVVELQAK